MNNKVEMVENYINAGISPILIEDGSDKMFSNAVRLEADCDASFLNGHYEDINFVAPKWYYELCEKSKNTRSLLLINELNKVSPEEQLKFLELFKYKKISTFDLPDNCVIVVTSSKLKENPIAQDIYSLMAHI